jgi:hypothetical protein
VNGPAPRVDGVALRRGILITSAVTAFISWGILVTTFAASIEQGAAIANVAVLYWTAGATYLVSSYAVAWAWFRFHALRAVPLALGLIVLGPLLLIFVGVIGGLGFGMANAAGSAVEGAGGTVADAQTSEMNHAATGGRVPGIDNARLGWARRIGAGLIAGFGLPAVGFLSGASGAGWDAGHLLREGIIFAAILAIPFLGLYRLALIGRSAELEPQRHQVATAFLFAGGALGGALAQAGLSG